jgi:hypothetical protein
MESTIRYSSPPEFVAKIAYQVGRKGASFRAGIEGPIKWSLLLLDVLLMKAQRRTTATCSEVGRRAQNIVPIAFLDSGSCNPE